MKSKGLNTNYTFEFCNGTTCQTTLAFYRLYQLKGKNPSLYKRYNQAMNSSANGSYDELDTITILYTAYVCANLTADEILNEEEFMMKCGSDRVAVANAVRNLTQPKKQ